MPISDKTQRIAYLVVQQLNGSLEDSGRKELNDWIALSEDNKRWYEQVTVDRDYLTQRLKEYEEAEALREDAWNKFVRPKPSIVRSLSRRVAVAAAVLIVVAAGAIYWLGKSRKINPVTAPVAQQTTNDVAPGGNKAILTLGNGSKIVLDEAKNGALAQQGKTNVMKLDSGQIAYSGQGNNQRALEIIWNTLATPRGGQYKLVLTDGTKVWLNAASSLRFPSSFTGKTRQVILTGGEAYFEVAKNSSMPFTVILPPISGGRGMEVEVLGTHFDVMAYEEEKTVKTTLLEGAVRVKSGTAQQVLSPGQRAQFAADGNLQVANDPDAEGSVAWINGNFMFRKNNIESVMRQLARWYDVEVTYEGKKTSHSFSGVISRDNNASDVLKALEVSDVHFKIEGKKIIVLP